MPTIKHEEMADSGLIKCEYEYWFDANLHQLVLGRYEEFERFSKRSNWHSAGKWSRTNLKHHNSIDREDIPGLHDVGKIVLQKFIEQITVEVE